MDRTKSLAVLMALAAGLCACRREPVIVVGSKNFTEQVILGEIVAQHLEKRLAPLRIERKLNLGGTLLAHQALTAGGIDVYPEYSGTALMAVLDRPVERDRAKVNEIVYRAYRERWSLVWMRPLGFNNTFAMVVRPDTPPSIRSLTDAALADRRWRLGIGYEFVDRPDGLKGLLETYPLKLDGAPKDMDLGLLYQALEQNQVDLAAGSTTDGLIDARNFRVLADDRHYFPPYEAALVVRGAALEAHPRLKAALEELSGRFTDESMRKMNYAVDGKHERVEEVARKFLRESGL